MTSSPRRLSNAQYDENGQNWPKLTFKRPAMAIFPKFEKLIPYLKSVHQTASEKSGSKALEQKVKKGVTLLPSAH